MTERILNERFRLAETIGHGGMSRVFRATDLESGATIALKLIPREMLDAAPEGRTISIRRFEREVRILKDLRDNPHVVDLIDSGESEGDYYIAMELVEGTSLRSVIQADAGRMETARYLFLARLLATSLRSIHVQRILHRDLSPDNVLLTSLGDDDPGIRFIDFGIGKSLEPDPDALTNRATIMGKPSYFSPEQARSQPLGPGSDVYSLGVILYEMLTGKLPIEVHNMAQLSKLRREAPVPLVHHPTSRIVPGILRTLIMSCLEKKAEDRPTTDELMECLDELWTRHDQGEEMNDGFSDWEFRQSEEQLLEVDQQFGPFETRAPLERDGETETWSCHDRRSGRDVVLRVFRPGHPARRQWLLGARASAALDHPHVVSILDIGRIGRLDYVASEHVAGESLAHHLEQGEFDSARLLHVTNGLIEALLHAHSHDPPVLHGGLTARHVLVDEFDHLMITGFGQSFPLGNLAHIRDARAVAYVAPELVRGSGPTIGSDIYALGCLLHQMATGTPLYSGRPMAVLYAHVNHPRPDIGETMSDLHPLGLGPLIRTCISQNPKHRPASLEVLKRTFDAVCATPDRTPRELTPPSRPLDSFKTWVKRLRKH